MILDVDKNTFGPEVLEATGKVVVDFYGDGCVPCAALMPHVHEFAEKYADSGIKFCAMNTTKARRLAIKMGIMGLPVMAIYENGEKIASVVKEEATVESIEAMIKAHI
jgi:thioredoxin 1